MKYLMIPLLSMLIGVLFISSCSNNKKKTATSNIEQYHSLISAYTSGEIKRSGTIVVRFTQTLAEQNTIGQTLPTNTLKFSPSISGETRWIAADAIEFVPEKMLPWDTKFTATLKLSSIKTDLPDTEKITFAFQTPRKQFTVEHSGLSIDSTSNLKYQIIGKINTSDQFEPAEVEKLITASQNNSKLNIEWNHHAKSYYHSFVIKEIKRLENNSNVELKWDTQKAGTKNENGIRKIAVPSINDFSISSATVFNTPDQYIELFFSDPVQPKTDFRGLLHIDNQPVRRVQVSNNALKAYPAERLTGLHTLVISPSIESLRGIKLNAEISYELNFGGLKPQVRLPGKGVIMPSSSGLYFPFEAVALNAVDVRITKIFTNNIHQFLQNNNFDENYQLNRVGRIVHRSKIDLTQKGVADLMNWNTYKIDLSKLIDVENGAFYNVEIAFRKSYSIYPCENTASVPDQYIAIDQESNYPERDYDWTYYNFYYDWQNTDDPCHHSYYAPYKFVNRNILGSNLGIVAKTDQQNRIHIFVSNILNTNPESDVSLELYDFQNQKIGSGKTNSEGYFTTKTEHEVFLITAQKDQNLGYLKIDNSTLQSTSNFDVNGQEVKKGIKGFLFGERDVWRPGDSVFVSFVLEDKLQQLPHGHPMIFEVYNPKGQMVNRMVSQRDHKNIYPAFFQTQSTDITGNWLLLAKIGPVQFSKSIRIETIKPNRLKVNFGFTDEQLLSGKTSQATLIAQWLHGANAGALKAKVDVNFIPVKPIFENYKDYNFSTPYEKFYGEEKTIFDGQLNEQGKATINFKYTPNAEATGFLRANFVSKVFEPGGDFSTNQMAMPFSPFTDYVGLKIDWAYKNWNKLDNDRDNEIQLVTVDETGKPINLNSVEIKLYELSYRWWYNGNHENLASYAGSTYHKPVFSTKVSSQNGKASFSIKKDEERWGRHLLLVTSPNGHTAGQVIYFGSSWGSNQHKGGAEMLAIVTETDKYKVNDEIKISFPANKEARALVTIESGSSVLAHEWLNNLDNFNHYTFTATPQMAPNIYVHITLIQPHNQSINDLPIRLYGVVPIMVEDPATRLEPVIDQPDEVRPLKSFNIKVSEANKQAMDYVLAIVDEGLLDLTNFKTPDPWKAFFAREALGVNTYDLYNYVMGSWGTRLESMYAVGGSDINIDNSKKQAERFKPVVKVLGPFHIDARQKANHQITLPQYVGSVRTMVVAAQNGQYGNAEKTLPVREPLMVLATLPRVLSPGEIVDLPVSVFAMKKNIDKVKVSIETNNLLTPLEETEQTVHFDEMGEKTIFFKLKVNEKIGVAHCKINALSGKEEAFNEIELDIRTPNPPMTKTHFKVLQAGEKWEHTIAPFGVSGTNSAQVEISSIPPLNLGERLNYLITYPHGCLEQITSAVFPQLYLPALFDLNNDESEKIAQNIAAGIEKIQRYQNNNGAFTYWPGALNVHNWSSYYASFFLVEAAKKGYMVPRNLENNFMANLRNQVSEYSTKNASFHLEQAFGLYVLSLAGEPNVSAMNRLRATSNMNNQTKWLLAAAYALAGMKEAAYQMINVRNMSPNEPQYQYFGSDLRNESIMLLTLNALNDKENAFQLAQKISEQLSSNEWYSTQSTAFALVALSNFAAGNNSVKELDYVLSQNGKNTARKSNKSFDMVKYENLNENKSIGIENRSSGNLFVSISNSGTPAETVKTAEMKGLRLIVNYMNPAGKAIDVEQIKQGSDFTAAVNINNQTGVAIENLALSQLFPAGWEIINSRMLGNDMQRQSSYDYQDVRDDRVFTYFGLKPYESKIFYVKLNATYSGTFKVPATSCEAMYNNNYKANTAGFETKVLK